MAKETVYNSLYIPYDKLQERVIKNSEDIKEQQLSMPTKVSQLTNDVGYAKTSDLDEYAKTTDVNSKQDKLSFDGTYDAVTNKVATEKTVTDKIAAVVASAPEDFDTLKEMSDWIASHKDSAAEMNSSIKANTDAIRDIQNAGYAKTSDVPSKVSQLENDTKYVNETQLNEAIASVGGGSGGVSSWNDLTDKPFGEEAAETFSASNKPHRELGDVFSMGTYGLVTDTVVPAVDELGSYSADVTFIYGEAQNTESVTYVLSEFVVENLNGGYKLTKSSPVNTPDALVFVVSDYATFIANYALEVERNGIYAYSTERDYSTPSYTSFANVTAIHKTETKTLDEKYIPDTIARVSDIPEGGSLVQIKRWEAND